MNQNTHQILETLIEKARKLQDFGLDVHMQETGHGFHVRRGSNDDLSIVEFDLPNDKERDASLLTLRMFTQQNEPFSFPQLNNIAEDPGLSNDFREFLNRSRRVYYDYLNGYPEQIEPGFFEDNIHPTRMDIYSTVMYGALAHTRDSNRRQNFDLWTRDNIREGVVMQAFSRIVYQLLRWIYQLGDISEQELTRHIAD